MAKIAIDEKGHVKDETITITSYDFPGSRWYLKLVRNKVFVFLLQRKTESF